MSKFSMGLCIMNENGEIVTSKQIGTQWNADLTQEHRRSYFKGKMRTQEIINNVTDTYKVQLKDSDVGELLDDFRVKEVYKNG